MKLTGSNTDPMTGDTDTQTDPITQPLGAGLTDLEGATDEGPKRSGSSPVVLVALLVVSGAVLWGMRHLGTRGSINLVDISIDYPLQNEAESANSELVIQALQESSFVPQVEPQMIAVNPFTWRASPETTVTADISREEAEAQRAHQQRMRALDNNARALVINSVMRGRVPLAKISGELVAVGDTVAGQFTVTRIEGREVDIEAEGRTWTLTVGGN